MKKALAALLTLTALFALAGCAGNPRTTAARTAAPEQPFCGSYTSGKTFSFDRRYYAVPEADGQMIRVSVYLASENVRVDEFRPARSMDFWGICWERDTYNIWTQSGDTGTRCYECRDGLWEEADPQRRPPSYIISRYDAHYRGHPELWDAMYVSPAE